MPFPKWKYRRNPEGGFFQSTLVLHKEAEAELSADWSDDPTGQPIVQGAALEASIHIVTSGDILNG